MNHYVEGFIDGAIVAACLGFLIAWRVLVIDRRKSRAVCDHWFMRAVASERGETAAGVESMVQRGILAFNEAHPNHPQARAFRKASLANDSRGAPSA